METAKRTGVVDRQTPLKRALVRELRVQHVIVERVRPVQVDCQLAVVLVRRVEVAKARGPARSRKVEPVHLVEIQRQVSATACACSAVREDERRDSGRQVVLQPTLPPAGMQLAELSDVDAGAERSDAAEHFIVRKFVVVLIETHRFLAVGQTTFDEVALAGVERLVQIDAELVRAADFGADQQFAAERVEPGLVVGRAQREGRVLLEIALQVDAKTQVVGPPAFFDGHHVKDIAVAHIDQRVVDALVPAVAVDAQHVPVDTRIVDRIAALDAQMTLDGGRIDPLQTVDHDGVDGRRRLADIGNVLRPGGILVGTHGQSAQAFGHGFRRGPAAIGRFRTSLEVARGNALQIGLDVDVARLEQRQRTAHVLLGQDVDHLRRDGE